MGRHGAHIVYRICLFYNAIGFAMAQPCSRQGHWKDHTESNSQLCTTAFAMHGGCKLKAAGSALLNGGYISESVGFALLISGKYKNEPELILLCLLEGANESLLVLLWLMDGANRSLLVLRINGGYK